MTATDEFGEPLPPTPAEDGAVRRNAEGVPVMGRKEMVRRGQQDTPHAEREKIRITWGETTVHHVLTSRATFGEFTPRKGTGWKRDAAGEPIPDYFPAVIEPDTFHAATAALLDRRTRMPGRRGKRLNLLSGLLVDARSGSALSYKHCEPTSVLIPSAALKGGAKWTTFPAVAFEEALRSRLVEVKASDVAGDGGEARRVEALSARVAELDALIAAWTAKMDNPDTVDIVAAKLAELNAKRKGATAELAEAQREASSPVAEAWGRYRTLAGMDPAEDTDDLRTQIRAAMRRVIESVYCLFVGKHNRRVAAAQVYFKSGLVRSYLIPAQGWETRTRSLPDAELSGAAAAFDLRRPADVRALERQLTSRDLATLLQ